MPPVEIPVPLTALVWTRQLLQQEGRRHVVVGNREVLELDPSPYYFLTTVTLRRLLPCRVPYLPGT